MENDEQRQFLKRLIGLEIIEIRYAFPDLKYATNESSAYWSTINPKNHLIHSPEWEFQFSDGHTLYLTNTHEESSTEALKSGITASNYSLLQKVKSFYSAPRSFEWIDIFENPITQIKIAKRIIGYKKQWGKGSEKIFQPGVQIIQIYCGGKTIACTTMCGDLGQRTYYPNGYLRNSLGIFLNKDLAQQVKVGEVAMEMDIMNI